MDDTQSVVVTGITTKGRYMLNIIDAVQADGGTRADILSEVNRIFEPEEWQAAFERGEVTRWVPPSAR